MYSGVYEDLDPLDTPINLFETDVEQIKKYRLMKIGDVYQAEMEKGGCLYIPAYYWFQSETYAAPEAEESGVSSFITFEYEASSLIVQQLIEAIDQGIMDE